ncbi:hypothetical protein WL40_19020 [Burkholderia ubonensis]|uniref:Uncharacterized protein n=1 Tax=Burkholderia ubonensis TaxID=101571 RepID=A0ABD4E623_9BURK|nr:hypothetical protein WJ41_15745 [Burkholderia ubonensis]KVM04248.1 hypothetical protein WJ52_31150 [Burkholderia ubonensis]KVN87416.1 hypothetical protein WJ68_08305 [Burkholderia ubonensis]KVN94140.1 hypothetical protein WJ71_03765 [Burkholderia ubonensis]KVO01098.1 hypothetical protein WJ69_29700 [Burkholderia ubonensis]
MATVAQKCKIPLRAAPGLAGQIAIAIIHLHVCRQTLGDRGCQPVAARGLIGIPRHRLRGVSDGAQYDTRSALLRRSPRISQHQGKSRPLAGNDAERIVLMLESIGIVEPMQVIHVERGIHAANDTEIDFPSFQEIG